LSEQDHYEAYRVKKDRTKKRFILPVVIGFVCIIAGVIFLWNFIFASVYPCHKNTYRLTMGGTERVLKFREAFQTDGFNSIDAYRDEAGNSYRFLHVTGELVGYKEADAVIEKEMKAVSKEDIKAIAEQFLNSFVDFKKYVPVDSHEVSDQNNYNFSYAVKIQDYETVDRINVRVDKFGDISNYESQYRGMFQGVTVPVIDKDQMNKSIDRYYHLIYTDGSYEIEYQRLCRNKKGTIVLQVCVYPKIYYPMINPSFSFDINILR